MGTGYTRNDTSNNIADGNIVNASDLDGEFDAVESAFATSGHTHDGTAAEGGPVTVVGPAQDVVVSGTNVNPKTTNTLDLGTASLKYKDAYLQGDITVDGTVDGRDVATDGAKLDGIESSATADQTDAEIRAAVEAAIDSNVFTDADHTKLNGIEAGADVTDTTNVTAAGALMDSELTDLAGVKGVTISTLQVKPSEGAFANGDKTKLDGIEANADVTDATNVTAAGALMDSEVTNLAQVKAFDSADYATAAQGTTADAALPKSGGTMTGTIASFESTGIDDNATSTQLTISDTTSTFAGDVSVNGGTINIAKTTVNKISTLRDDTSVSDNNGLLNIDASAKTPNGTEVVGSRITSEGDGTWTDTSAPTRINFNTTPVSGVVPVQALVIDSSQNATFAGDVTLDKLAPVLTLSDTDSTLITDQLIGELRFDQSDGSGGGPGTVGSIGAYAADGLGEATYLSLKVNDGTSNTEVMNLSGYAGNLSTTFAGDINFSGSAPDVLLNADNDRLVVSGGDATSSGANIIFYGDNHASNANKMIFRNSATTALTINASQDATFAGDVTIDTNANGATLTIRSPNQTWSGGENLGGIDWYTEDPSGDAPGVIAKMYVENNFSNTLPNAEMVFSSASSSGTSQVEHLRFDPGGGSSSAEFAGAASFGGTLNFYGIRSNTAGSGAYATHIGGGGTWEFRVATSGSSLNWDWQNALKARMLTSGDWQNVNNSYGAISDRAVKQDITDARSQWDDIKAIQLRNFRYIDEVEADESAKEHLGVIAQEVQEVSAGLVTQSSEEEHLGVNYMLMCIKAVGALQEAMTKIEDLEARVATLESAE